MNRSSKRTTDAPPRGRAPAAPAARGHDDGEVAFLSAIVDTQSAIAAANLDPHDVVAVVMERAQQLTRAGGAVVEVLDGDDMVLWAAGGMAAGHVGLRIPASRSLSGLALRMGCALRCDDSETDPRVDREACRRIGLRSLVVVPLRHDGSVHGVLEVLSPVPCAFGPNDVRALELLASMIAATLRHADDYSGALARLAARDRGRPPSDPGAGWARRIASVLANRSLWVVYQPIIDLERAGLVGFEALSRFPGPDPSPEPWFAAAAQIGRGVELEVLAVDTALAALESIPPHAYLGVNVSPEAAASPDLAEALRDVPPGRVVIEITEHASVEDYPRIVERLRVLAERGVRLAIDDAGAGFASFRHIVHLKPDIIKLDNSLTRDIERDLHRQTLAYTLVDFATRTGTTIVAEGIETAPQLEVLRALGVPAGQGFHLGRPGPLPDRLALKGLPTAS